MAVIQLIGNNASGLDARTIINQVITATNEELVSSVTYSAGVLTVSYKDGTTQTYTITSSGGGGDMFASIYDPAGIEQQLVGLTATQTLTNKTLIDYSNTIHADLIHYRIKCVDAGNIVSGAPLAFSGFNAGENAIEVVRANQATGVAIGISMQDLSNGDFGLMVIAGILEGITTDNYPKAGGTANEGDILYVDGLGLLTGDEPTTGFAQPIALLVRKSATVGAIQVLAAYPKQDAADVRFTPSGDISSTNVQTSLEELDNDKAPRVHTHDAAEVVSGVFDNDRISQSSVIQHQAALSITESQISDLLHDADRIKGVRIDPAVATPSDSDILVYKAVSDSWILEPKPAGGSNPALNDVTDVTISTPSDNDVLAYDTTTGDWINQTASEAGLATAAQGALADTALQPSAIGVSVQAHSAVLDATTASFTTADESKLDGIEAGADVTDATNVAAAGALMDGNFSANGYMQRTGAGTYTTSALPCEIQVACSDLTTALTTGTTKAYFRMPYAMTLTGVRASLLTAGSTSGTTTIDINESGTSILSTKLTIDAGEKTSTTAATAAVISDSALADDAEMTIDIDATTGGATEAGLIVTLKGTRA